MHTDNRLKDKKSKMSFLSARDGIGMLLYIAAFVFVGILDPYKDNLVHIAFYLLLIITAVVLFVVNKRFKCNFINVATGLILFVEMALLIMTGGSQGFKEDPILEHIIPHKETTYIERASDGSGYLDLSFGMYYFRNKEIFCNADVAEDLRLIKSETNEYYYNYLTNENNLVCWNIRLSELAKSNERYVDQYNNTYVVDDGVGSGKLVVVKEPSGRLLFCSESLYNISIGEIEYQYNEIESNNEAARKKLAMIATKNSEGEKISYTMIVNVASIIVFLIIGVIVCISYCPEWGGWMTGMLSIPFGIVVWTISGLFLVICRLPYNLYTQGTVIIIMAAVMIIRKRKRFREFQYRKLFLPVMILLFCTVYYAVTCHTITWGDSLMKLTHGLILAIDNHPEIRFSRMMMYGMIEPYVHSLGYMLGGDYIYVLYPVFYIIAIGLILGGLHNICCVINSEKLSVSRLVGQYKYWGFLALVALGILISNTDFRYAKYYVMSHILVAVYFLIMAVSMLLCKTTEIYKGRFELGILIPVVAIMVTRSEGIIYILFILTTFVGYMKDRTFYKTAYTAVILCVGWTAIQLCMFNGDTGGGYFFSPMKGCVLIVGSLAATVYLFMVSKKKLGFLTERHYMLKYLLGMMLIIVAGSFVINREMAAQNLGMYISHMSSYMEPMINSGYLWSLIFISTAVLFIINDGISELSAGIILGYIGLVFLIFLFRKDLPMRAGFGDSCRRILVQIMPTAIFLILGNMLKQS